MKTVDFDASIYSENAITKAIYAYKRYADITFIKTDSHIKCTIDNCKYDEGTTVNEFCNYVLGCVIV